MQIITKAQANKILVESLFKPVNGHTLRRIPYTMAKYQAKPETPYVGRDVPVGSPSGIHAIYPELRRDKDGTYVRLMCICEN